MRNLTIVLVVLALAGCDGSSSTGANAAQMQALQKQVTDLQTQVAALQQQQHSAPAVFIRAPNAPAVAVKLALRASDKAALTPSAASTCTGLGTLTGRPSDSDPIKSDNVSGVSCAGFYFTVSGAAASTDTALVQPLQSTLAVWFDSPNCTGTAYVSVANGSAQSLSSGALANGAVFRAYANGVNDPTDVSTYWMLKPGTAKVAPLLLSYLQGPQCSPASLTFDVYQLEPNDPTVSGVPSAPIPGPVTIS